MPSPKLYNQAVGALVEVSVNWTVSGAEPETRSALNPASGASTLVVAVVPVLVTIEETVPKFLLSSSVLVPKVYAVSGVSPVTVQVCAPGATHPMEAPFRNIRILQKSASFGSVQVQVIDVGVTAVARRLAVVAGGVASEPGVAGVVGVAVGITVVGVGITGVGVRVGVDVGVGVTRGVEVGVGVGEAGPDARFTTIFFDEAVERAG